MKILLAEDELLSRRVVERDLRKLGYDVEAVSDGLSAWERFSAGPCQIVVTDWEMPGLSGVELVRRIRHVQTEEYVYIILLTSRAAKADLVEGMEAGADDFITKPFEFDELRVRLRAGQRIIELERSLTGRTRELEAWKARVKKSLEAASAIQQAFLPVALPEIPGLEFAWSYQPCEELGGDTLNVVPLDDHQVGFFVLDVSGHGVGAALLSVTLSRLLSADSGSLLRQPCQDGSGFQLTPPAELAAILNERFTWNEKTEQYFTLFYGIVNAQSRELQYVVCGHPSPIYLTDGSPPAFLPGTGAPIGIAPEVTFDQHHRTLRPGDRLFIYSDGLSEAMNPEGRMLGTDGLINHLANGRDLNLDATIARLRLELDRWRGGVPFHDDVSLLAVALR